MGWTTAVPALLFVFLALAHLDHMPKRLAVQKGWVPLSDLAHEVLLEHVFAGPKVAHLMLVTLQQGSPSCPCHLIERF